MKYGDTLSQRSIPEWGHYNIDYDHLKDLIKHHTTPGIGKALSIPGQGETTERAFSDTFLQVLKGQHLRINLFIKSKSGEIQRRLEFLSKQVAQLQARRPNAAPGTRLPAKTVERYARIDADVTKAGEEIRSLSRFRVAQRTGFYKILKKYKRWTKDREVERRFKAEVINSPDSLFQLDLGYLLDQYIDVLGAVRTPLAASGISGLSGEGSQRSPAAELAHAIEAAPEIDFDIALTTVPLGPRASRATYWVHPDHIVEVEVLLLQHLRLHTRSEKSQSSSETSPHATLVRRPSSKIVEMHSSSEDDVGLLVLDQPESFARRQNASPVGSSEEIPGSLPAKAAANVRWTSSGEAAVIVGLDWNDSQLSVDSIAIAKIERKYLETFLDPSASLDATDSAEEHTAAARRWLAEHTATQPIAGIVSKRTRFVGLYNNPTGGIWATLDTEIALTDSLHKTLKKNDWVSEARANSTSFPHAVLEIRREGHQMAGLIQLLDRSHLVERVRGFSLEAHAVWTCNSPIAMSPPIWLSLLEGDIRKLPAPQKRQRRKASTTTDSMSQSPPHTSTSTTPITSVISPYTPRPEDTSATSISEFTDPPPLNAFRKKSKKARSYFPPTQPEAERQRYWNEYDNPESDEEGYYIYVDPNAETKFPGQELLEACAGHFRGLLGLGKIDEVETPLLSTADSGLSDDGNETVDGSPLVTVMNYGTISPTARDQTRQNFFSSILNSLRSPRRDVDALANIERRTLLDEIHVRRHERDMAKFQLYASCLLAGGVLDTTLIILSTTSRKKLRGEVDSTIVVGVICNLLLLLVAVTSMHTRQERLGWVHQGTVVVLLVGMVVVDALLFRWALNV